MNELPDLRLSMTDISKRYGAVHALTDVAFELRSGEVMALLGENGAGKSTLVKILSGLVRPDEGEIRIDSAAVSLASPAAAQRAGIAVVQQEYSTVPSMSVAENLQLGLSDSPRWWSPARLDEHAGALLDRVGLGDVAPTTAVGALSVAEMQLVEIAKVLARDARIVVFDEPTAALSDGETERVLAVVRSLAAEGRSIIYVTHRLAEVFEVADRITIFRNGCNQPAAGVDELDTDTIITRMLGRELGAMFPPRPSRTGADDGAGLTVDGMTARGLAGPVSFSLARGEIVGFTGQMGSGASAALRALAGVVPVFGGAVTLGGENLNLRSRRAGIAAGVAYCSPDRKRDGIFAGLSVRRNISSPWLASVARVGLISPRDERNAAAAAAKGFAIDRKRMQAKVGSLSGGNQQKVAVGKWLGIAPKLLVIDEPTRGVDVGARAEIYRQLRDVAEAGTMILVASSDTAEVHGLCDRIATFSRGRMTSLRPYYEWTEPDLVREVMHAEAGHS